jgi:hypothetical protein
MRIPRELVGFLTLLALIATPTTSTSVADGLSEFQVKAAFIVNFARFVEWPASAFDAPSAPFVMGILGDDPFGTDLDQAVRDKMIGGHPILVKRIEDGDDLVRFHLVFIAGSEKRRLKDHLTRLGTGAVLTVSDLDGFCANGGLIGFVTVNDRIRFKVNASSAQRHGLKISSKLLTLALSTD